MIKNTYITSHFPLISIMLFSTSLAIKSMLVIIEYLKNFGVYTGMLEFFSESGIKITLFFLLLLVYFMILAALKLIADTVSGLSILFFSRDVEGHSLKKIRSGSLIYFICSIISVGLISSMTLIIGIFCLASLIYFIFFVYKISDSLSFAGMLGIVFFQLVFWGAFFLAVIFAVLKLYNSFISSLPL